MVVSAFGSSFLSITVPVFAGAVVDTAVSGAEDVVLLALSAVQALVSITLIRVIVASMVWVRFILGSSFVGFGTISSSIL